ncbi:hypothetical protein B0O80DRAFT_439463 [Mortierella sp. GBAus27b]|nr:hypothetical protein BGX31_005840 [Mortierella sp. GBA43]KAI8360512.1 hypothetical protein B0O80DRAFT_439463 [Mortierella sp. GBAus27b]
MKIRVSPALRPILFLSLATQLIGASPLVLNGDVDHEPIFHMEVMPHTKYSVVANPGSTTQVKTDSGAIIKGNAKVAVLDHGRKPRLQTDTNARIDKTKDDEDEEQVGDDEDEDMYGYGYYPEDLEYDNGNEEGVEQDPVHDGEGMEGLEDLDGDSSVKAGIESDLDTTNVDHDNQASDLLGAEQAESEDVDDDVNDDSDDDQVDKDELALEEEEKDLPTCPIRQKRSKIPEPIAEHSTDSKDSSGDAMMEAAVKEIIDKDMGAVDPKLGALATPEPGGACIDSFVNYALRFRERCSIPCLRTMAHIFSNPNVLGLLNCFQCSNFLVQGLYALGVDCAGLFANVGSVTPAPGVRMQDSKDDLRLGDIQKDVNPADAELFPLNFGDMVKSLHSVDMKDLQDWFDLGQDIYRVVETNGRAAEAEVKAKNGTISEEEKSQVKEEQVEVDRSLFNKFVSKAAGFANWTLTPDMVENTGVYDRLHDLKVL